MSHLPDMSQQSDSTELVAWSGLTVANFSSVAGSFSHDSFLGKPFVEQEITMLISVIGLVVAVLGFVYTVWKGERSHRLQVRQLEQNERMLAAKESQL